MPTTTATKSVNTTALVQRVDELEKLVVTLNEKIQLLESTPKKLVAEVGAMTTKKETKGLKKNGEPRKKRAPCGYMIFSNEKRAEVREELVEEADGEKVPPGAVVWRVGSSAQARPES